MTLLLRSNTDSGVGILLRCRYQIDATGFVSVPFIQLGDHLNQPTRHDIETPCSTAGDGDAAFKCDHIAIPVGALSVGRRLCSLDRYDLVILSHCIVREKTDPAFCDRCSNSNFGESVYDLSHEAFNCRMINRESGLQ